MMCICDLCAHFSAGICTVKGEAAMTIDGDLQNCTFFVFDRRDMQPEPEEEFEPESDREAYE